MDDTESLFCNQRIAVVIDTQNVYYAARDLYEKLAEDCPDEVENKVGRVDFAELLNHIVGDRTLVHCVAFTTSTEEVDNTAFLRVLRDLRVTTKNRVVNPEKNRAMTWTTSFICEAMKWAASGKVDAIVLVTGSGIYTDLAEYLRHYPISVEVASFTSVLSRALKETADRFIALEVDHLANKQ